VWIVRDENRKLYFYTRKPKREEGGRFAGGGCVGALGGPYILCPELTWENSPKKVKSIKIELK